MMLTEFLLARIAEDEEAAQDGLLEPTYGVGIYGENAADEVLGMAGNEGLGWAGRDHFARWMPARALAECEAKRRMIEEHPGYEIRLRNAGTGDIECVVCRPLDQEDEWDRQAWPCATLRHLALPYADHPDYDQAWAV